MPVVPIHNCIPSAVTALLRRQPLTPAKVALAWRTAVGPLIDQASSVVLAGNGRLDVIVSDPNWRRELERSTPLVMARLESLMGSGVIRQIVIATVSSNDRGGSPTRKSR